MLDGFTAELDARKASIESAKTDLETTYADTLGKDEKAVVENAELMGIIQKHMATIDAAFTSFNGTLKSIKTSIDTWLNLLTSKCFVWIHVTTGSYHHPPGTQDPPKAKAKAKAAPAAPAEPAAPNAS